MAQLVLLGEDLAAAALAWHLTNLGYCDFVRFYQPGSSPDPVDWNGSPALPNGAAEWVRQLVGEEAVLPMVEWGLVQDRLIRLPVETHLTGLPVELAKEWLLGFIRAQEAGARRKPERRGSSLEDWVRQNYGAGIAEGFWLPYFAKRAAVLPRELIASAAEDQLVPATLEEAVEGVLGTSPASLGPVPSSWIVEGGSRRLCTALSQSIPSRPWPGSCEIDLARRTIRFQNGDSLEYSELVSSLPLPGLGRMLRGVPDEVRNALASLRYASCSRTTLSVLGSLPEHRHILIPGPEHRFHRIFVETADQGGAPVRFSIDTAAIAGQVSADDPEGEESALRRIGLVREHDQVVERTVRHLDIEYALQYPRHHQSVRLVTHFLEEHGVVTLGPLGAWNNDGMAETLATAERVAKAVVQSHQHGLPVRAPERMPQVSIVIPVYREEAVLEQFTGQIIEAVDRLEIPYELILAENGGLDRTGEIADRLATRFQQVRAVHYPEPNYGKALAMGILSATGENVVCFEIDFWDAEFVEIVQVLLKKYDAVIGSKRAPGARDRRPFLRRAITSSFNLFLKMVYGFQGTDTHGIKAFRREKALPIVRDCATGKDIFATELVIRMERAGLYICEMPLEIQELRSPSINLLKRVPSTIRNLIALWRAIRKLPKTDYRKMEPAPKVSIAS